MPRREHRARIGVISDTHGLLRPEAVRALRSRPDTARIPVVALTGDVSLQTLEATRAAGFDGWLEKPLNIDELIAILSRQLGRSDK